MESSYWARTFGTKRSQNKFLLYSRCNSLSTLWGFAKAPSKTSKFLWRTSQKKKSYPSVFIVINLALGTKIQLLLEMKKALTKINRHCDSINPHTSGLPSSIFAHYTKNQQTFSAKSSMVNSFSSADLMISITTHSTLPLRHEKSHKK